MHKGRALAAVVIVLFCSASNAIWYPEASLELRREAWDGLLGAQPAPARATNHSYDDSLVLAPLYVDYAKKPPEQFASDVAELKRRIGQASHVLLGFAAYIDVKYPDIPLDRAVREA